MDAFVLYKDGRPANPNFGWAEDGLNKLGYYTVPIGKNDLYKLFKEGSLNKDTPVIAGVEMINELFELLDVANPWLTTYPESLKDYLAPDLGIHKLSDARHLPKPFFVKPLDKQRKLFTGTLIRMTSDLVTKLVIDMDTKVFCRGAVNFVSEFRVYVSNSTVIGIKHYKGNPFIVPDWEVINKIGKTYIDGPLTYLLDIGVTDKGETKVVEINDATCPGNYGLPPITFAKMIVNRFAEIYGQQLPYPIFESL